MKFLDRIIAAVSPEAAYKREAYRQAYDWLRNYDAGNYDRPNQNWRVTNQSAELTDRYSRDAVRARAVFSRACPALTVCPVWILLDLSCLFLILV